MRSFVAHAVVLFGFAAPWTHTSSDPLAQLEDYRRRAGREVGDTMVVEFDLTQVRWRPEGPAGAELPVFAFVERGQPARVPGPMIRVRAGTIVRATIRNVTDTRMAVFGLQDHDRAITAFSYDSVIVAPGAEETVSFHANTAGTYYYWGRVRADTTSSTAQIGLQVPGGPAGEGPFVGVLIVDAAGTAPPPDERVLMLARWFDSKYPGIDEEGTWKVTVNGASWPHTERLTYTVGDTVRWRVLNPMGIYHPMHLHGFYFDVTARGDGRRDTLYTPEQRRSAVTELMLSFSTMALAWVPERPGNWLFHCHLIKHMALKQRIGPPRAPADTADTAHASHASHAPASDRAEDHMAGLISGIHVVPRPGREAVASLARATGRSYPAGPERMLRLLATTRPNVFGDAPAFSFVLQSGRAPAPDSIRELSSPIILERGQPVRITVLNRIGKPLAVHWHGMEIDSWYDGVGGWSGAGQSLRPAIAPLDSFAVRMIPPRAGTFIYHTHNESSNELAGGLYGALLVLEPGATRDTTRDHVIVLGLRGVGAKAPFAINGKTKPDSLVLAPDVRHRLRFVSIPSSELIRVDLLRGDSTVTTWRPIASDGADLSAAQRVDRPARIALSAGQTFDAEVRVPASDTARYQLRFRTTPYPGGPQRGVTLMPIAAR